MILFISQVRSSETYNLIPLENQQSEYGLTPLKNQQVSVFFEKGVSAVKSR